MAKDTNTSSGTTNQTSTRTPNRSDDYVLVPPDGVHTPGNVAADASQGQALVRAPADAFSDHDGAVAAYRDAQEGNAHKMGTTRIAHQHADGSALTPDEHDAAEQAQDDQEAALGDPTAKPEGITK